ncbi:AMP-binding protein [Dactylosporangium roseum]|uniref:AMP-binding protein n=1 Tax=Dactylosporangium roseum TaxID=47989 RepID=A0ABY5Z140_9ACTN|nr:AMP-binding protein [Dactylosporangium roseum]UWZ34770.1 AMP-binding protein [Dactylosporangium roseum]
MARVRECVDNLHGLLTAPATSVPDQVAIAESSIGEAPAVVSYRQLVEQVERFAVALDALGLDVGDRVVVESRTSAAAIALLLACSALGLPFVPVTAEVPDRRVQAIVDAVEPALYVRDAGTDRTGVMTMDGTARFGWNEWEVDRRPAARVRRRREVLATDTAYIVFTSGTSGRPKGVVMSHRSVVTFLRAVLGDGRVLSGDRIASTSPLHFDFALFDIGIALGGGATLVPVQRELLASPRRFVAHLKANRVSQVNGVPSIWRPVLRHNPELLGGLTDLRSMLFAGEEFPLPELRRLQSVVPGVRVVNGYGATESMACSFTDVPNPLPVDADRLSIGALHTGAEVMLIGEDGTVVTHPGVVGEIHLRSPALFSGYWNDPEATAAVLVPDPVDSRHGQVVLRSGDLACWDAEGGLYFCGRADAQVQVRGNRVELGEVEGTLGNLPGVDMAVVVAVARPSGDRALVAYVVPTRPWPDFDQAKAVEFCARELPAYMVPRRIDVVSELPLTANGKVNRELLRRRATADLSVNRSSVTTRTEATHD